MAYRSQLEEGSRDHIESCAGTKRNYERDITDMCGGQTYLQAVILHSNKETPALAQLHLALYFPPCYQLRSLISVYFLRRQYSASNLGFIIISLQQLPSRGRTSWRPTKDQSTFQQPLKVEKVISNHRVRILTIPILLVQPILGQSSISSSL